MLVEKHFRVLKQFYRLITAMTRSAAGYLANYFYALTVYTLSQ